MDYQNYQIRSFDDDAPEEEEEGQLQVRSGTSSFDTPQYEGAAGSGAGFEDDTPHQEPAAGVTDFASIKFQRENTLLTNAERYAESIREEAELYVRQLQKEIEGLNEQADRRYEEAREWMLKAVERNPEFPEFHIVLAATLGHLGETDRARKSLDECERLWPTYFKESSTWFWYKHEADNEHFRDGLRKAGWEG